MIDEEKLIEEITNLYNEYANDQTRFEREETKAIYRFIGALTYRIENMPKENEWIPINNWIPIEVDLPPEHESMFAKLKGTDKWMDGMFENISDNVQVTVEFENGKRLVDMAHTQDGKWKLSTFKVMKPKKVVAWKPLSLPFDER